MWKINSDEIAVYEHLLKTSSLPAFVETANSLNTLMYSLSLLNLAKRVKLALALTDHEWTYVLSLQLILNRLGIILTPDILSSGTIP